MSEAVSAAASEEAPPARSAPVVNVLGKDDLWDALVAGWRDLRAAPKYGLAFGLLYAAGGWTVMLLATSIGYYFLAYPLAAGFALVAPFVAVGFYEVSRRLELGLPITWGDVLRAIFGGGKSDLGWMALVTSFTFFIWMDIAFFLYAMFFGMVVPKPAAMLTAIATTQAGLMFAIVGNLVGACIAFFVFSITVVSFPMLLDREVDFVTAMTTSLRVVRANLTKMIFWALMLAMLVLFSFLTGLLGLIVVLPWLGHATWHVYRKAVG